MTRTAISRLLVGSLIAVAGVLGGILQFVSTTGAVAATVARVQDEVWLLLVLAPGLLGLVIAGTVLYAFTGPRSRRAAARLATGSHAA